MASTDGKQRPRSKDSAGAQRLKALRQEMGWSPETLGAMAGVSGKWIREIETSHREPTEGVKARLARPFRMLPSDIWRKSKQSVLSPEDREHLRGLVRA